MDERKYFTVTFSAEIGKHNHQSCVMEFVEGTPDEEIQLEYDDWILGYVGGSWYLGGTLEDE